MVKELKYNPYLNKMEVVERTLGELEEEVRQYQNALMDFDPTAETQSAHVMLQEVFVHILGEVQSGLFEERIKRLHKQGGRPRLFLREVAEAALHRGVRNEYLNELLFRCETRVQKRRSLPSMQAAKKRVKRLTDRAYVAVHGEKPPKTKGFFKQSR